MEAAAQPLLEKKISLRVSNERLDEVLRQIGEKGGFSFAYSPDAIDVQSRVSVNASNQAVRTILTDLFKGTVAFKEKRKYIILKKVAVAETSPPESFLLNGYILDYKTGDPLTNASVYEPTTLASTVSNQYGYYKIRLPTAPTQLQLEIRKEGYLARTVDVRSRRDNTLLTLELTADTLMALTPTTPRTLARRDSAKSTLEYPQVVLAPVPPPATKVPVPQKYPDTTQQQKNYAPRTFQEHLLKVRDGLVYAFSSTRQAIHTENITDTLYRTFQASIIPFIGTNQQLSGNVINTFSLNLVAGYSLGVDALEVGLGLNMVRWNVRGAQLAGLGNVVGRDVDGAQLAGFGNITIGSLNGMQAAGTFNITAEDVTGVQIASAGNAAGRNLRGWQVSGGLNYARTVLSGHQLGFINYADSSATTPFGYLSFIRKNGYRRFEISTDELHYFSTTFKTGVPAFYNIFILSFNAFAPGKPLGSLGYGLGTARLLGRPRPRSWMLNADLTGSRLAIQRRFLRQERVHHYRLAVALEKKLTSRMALSLGPTFNLLRSPYRGLVASEQPWIEPLWVGQPSGSRRTYFWLGAQLSLRWCNKTF